MFSRRLHAVYRKFTVLKNKPKRDPPPHATPQGGVQMVHIP